MIRKLLCFFGLHVMSNDYYGSMGIRKCWYCGKQERYDDHV